MNTTNNSPWVGLIIIFFATAGLSKTIFAGSIVVIPVKPFPSSVFLDGANKAVGTYKVSGDPSMAITVNSGVVGQTPSHCDATGNTVVELKLPNTVVAGKSVELTISAYYTKARANKYLITYPIKVEIIKDRSHSVIVSPSLLQNDTVIMRSPSAAGRINSPTANKNQNNQNIPLLSKEPPTPTAQKTQKIDNSKKEMKSILIQKESQDLFHAQQQSETQNIVLAPQQPLTLQTLKTQPTAISIQQQLQQEQSQKVGQTAEKIIRLAINAGEKEAKKETGSLQEEQTSSTKQILVRGGILDAKQSLTLQTLQTQPAAIDIQLPQKQNQKIVEQTAEKIIRAVKVSATEQEQEVNVELQRQQAEKPAFALQQEGEIKNSFPKTQETYELKKLKTTQFAVSNSNQQETQQKIQAQKAPLKSLEICTCASCNQIAIGGLIEIKVCKKYEDGYEELGNTDLEWFVSDNDLIAFDQENMKIVAKKAGEVEITATYTKNPTIFKTIKLVVADREQVEKRDIATSPLLLQTNRAQFLAQDGVQPYTEDGKFFDSVVFDDIDTIEGTKLGANTAKTKPAKNKPCFSCFKRRKGNE